MLINRRLRQSSDQIFVLARRQSAAGRELLQSLSELRGRGQLLLAAQLSEPLRIVTLIQQHI